jgi:hypothetical protein
MLFDVCMCCLIHVRSLIVNDMSCYAAVDGESCRRSYYLNPSVSMTFVVNSWVKNWELLLAKFSASFEIDKLTDALMLPVNRIFKNLHMKVSRKNSWKFTFVPLCSLLRPVTWLHLLTDLWRIPIPPRIHVE